MNKGNKEMGNEREHETTQKEIERINKRKGRQIEKVKWKKARKIENIVESCLYEKLGRDQGIKTMMTMQRRRWWWWWNINKQI